MQSKSYLDVIQPPLPFGRVMNAPDTIAAYLASVHAAPSLTREQECQLGWNIINEGCQASREQLACAHQRLVVAIASNYTSRGVRFPDLLDAGTVGLHRAVSTYDPATGVAFSTHASWWIKRLLLNVISASCKDVPA